MPRDKEPAGHNMGRMVSQLVANAIVHAKEATVDAEHEHRLRANEKLLDRWELKVGTHLARVYQDWPIIDNEPEAIKLAREISTKPRNATDIFSQIILLIVGCLALGTEAGKIVFEKRIMQDYRKADRPFRMAPDLAASAIVRLRSSFGDMDDIAARNGLNAADFEVMRQLAASYPPSSTAIQMARLGIIDQPELSRYLSRDGVAPEIIDKWLQLQHLPLSPAEALEAYIKGFLDEGRAKDYWVKGGMRAEDFDIAKKSVGDAVGVEAGNRLFLHRQISAQDLDLIIRHSRINPEFEPIAKKLGLHWMSAFEVQRIFSAGGCTIEEATRWLKEDGYPDDQIAAFTRGHTNGKAAAQKEASLSVIETSYEAGMIDRGAAEAAVTNLGYDRGQVGLILDTADARREVQSMNAALAAIRKAFLSGKYSETQASAAMDRIGIHPKARDAYLQDWPVEKAAAVKELTEAQIASLYKKGIISEAYVVKRLQGLGYDDEDIGLLMFGMGFPKPGDGPVR